MSLEECAKYPRILLGARYLAYLDVMAEEGPTYQDRTTARVLKSAVFQDPDDGLFGLDVLGNSFRHFFLSGMKADNVRKAWEFANRSRDRFKESGDLKLAGYYQRLIAYHPCSVSELLMT
ncbi:MAG TPA: hypothetical protein VNL92_00895 [Dehalococcoidia bacterium]|nr:hypothetical protein [Dehalococcoidia bacterium]